MATNRLTAEDLKKLRSVDFSTKPGYVYAEDVLSDEVGEVGTKEREEFDAKARAWYFGEMLRERRKKLGMTQKELAERVGRERTYINRIEKGETDLQLSSFIRIADALGLTIKLETPAVSGYGVMPACRGQKYLSDVEQVSYGKKKKASR